MKQPNLHGILAVTLFLLVARAAHAQQVTGAPGSPEMTAEQAKEAAEKNARGRD